jgi:hypothetical protein
MSVWASVLANAREQQTLESSTGDGDNTVDVVSAASDEVMRPVKAAGERSERDWEERAERVLVAAVVVVVGIGETNNEDEVDEEDAAAAGVENENKEEEDVEAGGKLAVVVVVGVEGTREVAEAADEEEEVAEEREVIGLGIGSTPRSRAHKTTILGTRMHRHKQILSRKAGRLCKCVCAAILRPCSCMCMHASVLQGAP